MYNNKGLFIPQGGLMKKNNIIKFYFLNFLVLATFNLAHPVTPRLINELELPIFMFGLFFALMSIGSYVFSPIWGSLSDFKGRKYFLIYGVLGYGFAQIGFGMSHHAFIISVFRFIAGAFSVSYIAVMMACINDLTTSENRIKSMAYLSATVAMGGAAGSILGGLVGSSNYFYTFIFQFICCLLIAIAILFFIPETLINKKKKPIKISLNHLKFKKTALDYHSLLGNLILTVILLNIMTTSYNSTIGFFVESALALPTYLNGIILSISPLIAIFVNFFVSPKVAKHFDGLKTLIFVTAVSGASLFIWSVNSNILIVAPFFLIYLIISALALPIYQGMIAEHAQDNAGELMGIQNSARSVGMVIGSLASGFLYDLGSRFPFILGSFAAFICFFLLLNQLHLQHKKR